MDPENGEIIKDIWSSQRMLNKNQQNSRFDPTGRPPKPKTSARQKDAKVSWQQTDLDSLVQNFEDEEQDKMFYNGTQN